MLKRNLNFIEEKQFSVLIKHWPLTTTLASASLASIKNILSTHVSVTLASLKRVG